MITNFESVWKGQFLFQDNLLSQNLLPGRLKEITTRKCTYLWLTRVGRSSAKVFLHKCLVGTSVLNGRYHSLTWPDFRSDGRVMCSLQILWFFEEQDEATTGFSVPNTEVLEDSSFSRIIELLTRALSSRLLLISRLIETSTYFQCNVPCSFVPVRVYHDTMQTEFDRQIPNFCR